MKRYIVWNGTRGLLLRSVLEVFSLTIGTVSPTTPIDCASELRLSTWVVRYSKHVESSI